MQNGVKFIDNSKKVMQAIDERLIAALYETAGEIQGDAVNESPTDKGNLRGSWTYHVEEDELKATIGSPLENAIWNEFGTGEYALGGKGRKTPWYVPVEGYTGSKPPTYNGNVVIVYGKKGKKFYKTDGKKPKRTLHKAFVQNKNTLRKAIEYHMKDMK